MSSQSTGVAKGASLHTCWAKGQVTNRWRADSIALQWGHTASRAKPLWCKLAPRARAPLQSFQRISFSFFRSVDVPHMTVPGEVIRGWRGNRRAFSWVQSCKVTSLDAVDTVSGLPPAEHVLCVKRAWFDLKDQVRYLREDKLDSHLVPIMAPAGMEIRNNEIFIHLSWRSKGPYVLSGGDPRVISNACSVPVTYHFSEMFQEQVTAQ